MWPDIGLIVLALGIGFLLGLLVRLPKPFTVDQLRRAFQVIERQHELIERQNKLLAKIVKEN